MWMNEARTVQKQTATQRLGKWRINIVKWKLSFIITLAVLRNTDKQKGSLHPASTLLKHCGLWHRTNKIM